MHGIILVDSESVARAGGEATTQESKFDQCRLMLEKFAYFQVVFGKLATKPRGASFRKCIIIFLAMLNRIWQHWSTLG